MVVCLVPVPPIATTQEVVSLTQNLKREEMETLATTLEGAEMVASPVLTLATTPEVLSPMTLDLKGE
jgi:hypothetical protein